MKQPGTCRGFSVAEILVAISLSAVIFSAGAMLFQSVSANHKRLATIHEVDLGEDTVANFYSIDSSTINVYTAPNFGRAGFANELRERFWEDVGQASAIYCLGRDGLNTIRTTTIDYPDGSPFLDSPSDFLTLLQSEYGADADVFVDYAGTSTAEDLSIYMIGPSNDADEISVIAIYDLDIVQDLDASDTLIGSYVSVRRYVGSDLANYYDIYYEAGEGNTFSPTAVHFPKAGGSSYEADADAARFMVAAESSFYFVWWPDPASHYLEAASPPEPTTPPYDANDPIMDYWHMGGRTSFMFAIPMFPSTY